MASKAKRGRDLVQQTFGGALYQQGRGFYSVLEFFAICRGQVLLEGALESTADVETFLLPDEPRTARYLRPGHDFARRLLVGREHLDSDVFADDRAREAVRSLLQGMEAPVPGRRRVPSKWQLRHFYPYPAEAIHYDAVERGRKHKKVSIERYQFRGAGGLAHKILRTDPDETRRAATREAMRRLLTNDGGAVGQLMSALAKHDEGDWRLESEDEITEKAFDDDVEDKSFWTEATEDSPLAEFRNSPTRWVDLLRDGVHRILTRPELSNFDRIDTLFHWIPFCIARHQLAMARRVSAAGPEDAALAFDAGHSKSPVRTRARQDLRDAIASIDASLIKAAENEAAKELLTGSAAWRKGPRAFFTTTMYAIGALNAHTGNRHFEVKPQLLQAIVHATVDKPMKLERFTKHVLGETMWMLCDTSSADALGDTDFDRQPLLANGKYLAARLDEVGLLRSFSDSTRMVGIHDV